jgi:signal transduction histidine kinase
VEGVVLSFFPFPYVRQGTRHEGLLYKWPDRCNRCDRQCEKSKDSGIQLCSYGVNFCRLDQDTLIAGLVIRDHVGRTDARAKMLRSGWPGPTTADVEAVRRTASTIRTEDVSALRARQERIITDYKASEDYKRDLLVLLKPDLQRMLAQIHDYRQFVSRVVQNMNVILQRRAQHEDFEHQLSQASHEEQAIYWAARLMEEKIQTAMFLLDPERIDDPRSVVPFRFHGCVTKYLKIYTRDFERKKISINVQGISFGSIWANPAALAVIPHTLLDNALKYAIPGSRVDVTYHESDSDIEFTVGSLGPKIDADEKERIFDLFYRGKHAKAAEPDGSGFGLYLSQLIATKLGTRIVVSQRSQPESGTSYWTEFSIRFKMAPS